MVDDDGNRYMDDNGEGYDLKKMRTFAEGTLENVIENPSASSNKMTLYRLKGDDNSKDLFEFLATNTYIEWSLARIGTDESESNMLGTNNEEKWTSVGHFLNNTGYTLREHIHNHPSGSEPSRNPDGKGGYTGDIPNVKLYKVNYKDIVLKVFDASCYMGIYYTYDESGVIDKEWVENSGCDED